ncbi:MAG: hypothetical protein H0U40_10505 [Chloroflexia bacterium]|nr:hypothetical protein [Chloroflexia bacterium]
MMKVRAIEPDDLDDIAGACLVALAAGAGDDWSVPAGELDWTCRRTLDHLVDVMVFYAVHLASRATGRLPLARDGDQGVTIDDLLTLTRATAAVLSGVARAAAPGARGFHPSGMADAAGFVAMGATELLVHTRDILSGLGRPFRPANEHLNLVLARIFPWAPADEPDRWAVFLYECGRAPLGDRPRRDPNWYWHSAPLDEWDGTVKRRTRPPGWR